MCSCICIVKYVDATIKSGVNGAILQFSYLSCITCSVYRLNRESRSILESTGTTSHFTDILVGRCFEYQNILDKSYSRSYDCENILEKFISAFAYQGPCSPTGASYDAFMNAAATNISENKAMFWSGTYTIAHEYAGSGKRFITMEDTLIGHLANGLIWCGQTEEPGINYQNCPAHDECPQESSKAFWGAASKTFASRAIGVVTLLLNGSNPTSPAFRTDSFFAEFELPSLSKSSVTKINILVAHDFINENRETCSGGSLLTLFKSIEDHELEYECFDDPESIIYLLCVDDPSSRECRHVSQLMKV